MSTESRIKDLCLKYFDDVGVTSAIRPPSFELYSKWIDQGYHGTMGYLKRHRERKSDPKSLLPEAKTWIGLATHYDTAEPLSVELAQELKDQKKGWIARYARGRDYHEVISEKHALLISELHSAFPDFKFLGSVDIQAVLERDVGARSGLGWIGKNTCLINQKRGSFFFLSEILTDLELVSDRPVFDHCGTCMRCIEACPTGALEEPHVLNSTKCISYWTIESKTAPPENLAKKFGQNIFGCDICQDVCPWNTKARKQNSLPEAFESGMVELKEFLSQDSDEIEERNKTSARNRAKGTRLKENAEIALRNCDE